MLIDKDYELNIQRIIRLLNVNKSIAEKLYKECGTDLDKIYVHLRKIKVEPVPRYTHCLRCGKPLKSKESKSIGYGKICLHKKNQHKIRKLNFVEDAYVESRTKRACHG